MKSQKVKITEVKLNPNNPRIIKDDKFAKLVKSIQDLPEMLEIRPIVVNSEMIVLGGNMRLKACKEAGLKEVSIIIADNLTEEQQREFLIKDNVSGGEWDFEMLANEWDVEQLDYWGLDMPKDKDLNEEDLFDIEIPFYTPSEIQPEINELADLKKTNLLIDKIDLLKIDQELKDILKARASFFTDFNFQKIADFYSQQEKEVKEIFEDLGMIILAPKEALKKGFIELQENVFEL
jgi:ParB-like chromosome segregation protein Spo0J